MIDHTDLHDILFLDIETVSQKQNFEELDQTWQELWDEKTQHIRKDQTAKEFYKHAGIWAEFGKIICISVGFFQKRTDNKRCFRIKSFYGNDEKSILIEFKELVDKYFNERKHRLCAHNGKEFDFPYIARRMLIHQIPLCECLKISGKKPWEIPHLDTMEMWKFGDYKNFTSLKLLTHILNIPSPKDDIDGSQVNDTYYNDTNQLGMKRITTYCQKDTLTVAQLVLKLSYMPLLNETTEVMIL